METSNRDQDGIQQEPQTQQTHHDLQSMSNVSSAMAALGTQRKTLMQFLGTISKVVENKPDTTISNDSANRWSNIEQNLMHLHKKTINDYDQIVGAMSKLITLNLLFRESTQRVEQAIRDGQNAEAAVGNNLMELKEIESTAYSVVQILEVQYTVDVDQALKQFELLLKETGENSLNIQSQLIDDMERLLFLINTEIDSLINNISISETRSELAIVEGEMQQAKSIINSSQLIAKQYEDQIKKYEVQFEEIESKAIEMAQDQKEFFRKRIEECKLQRQQLFEEQKKALEQITVQYQTIIKTTQNTINKATNLLSDPPQRTVEKGWWIFKKVYQEIDDQQVEVNKNALQISSNQNILIRNQLRSEQQTTNESFNIQIKSIDDQINSLIAQDGSSASSSQRIQEYKTFAQESIRKQQQNLTNSLTQLEDVISKNENSLARNTLKQKDLQEKLDQQIAKNEVELARAKKEKEDLEKKIQNEQDKIAKTLSELGFPSAKSAIASLQALKCLSQDLSKLTQKTSDSKYLSKVMDDLVKGRMRVLEQIGTGNYEVKVETKSQLQIDDTEVKNYIKKQYGENPALYTKINNIIVDGIQHMAKDADVNYLIELFKTEYQLNTIQATGLAKYLKVWCLESSSTTLDEIKIKKNQVLLAIGQIQTLFGQLAIQEDPKNDEKYKCIEKGN